MVIGRQTFKRGLVSAVDEGRLLVEKIPHCVLDFSACYLADVVFEFIEFYLVVVEDLG